MMPRTYASNSATKFFYKKLGPKKMSIITYLTTNLIYFFSLGQIQTKFNVDMVANRTDGSTQCTFCGSVYSNLGSARMHIVRLHLVPERFQCKICNDVIKHRLDFCNHIIRRHKMKGAKRVLETYAIPLSINSPL